MVIIERTFRLFFFGRNKFLQTYFQDFSRLLKIVYRAFFSLALIAWTGCTIAAPSPSPWLPLLPWMHVLWTSVCMPAGGYVGVPFITSTQHLTLLFHLRHSTCFSVNNKFDSSFLILTPFFPSSCLFCWLRPQHNVEYKRWQWVHEPWRKCSISHY